jgi:hypothetical protein
MYKVKRQNIINQNSSPLNSMQLNTVIDNDEMVDIYTPMTMQDEDGNDCQIPTLVETTSINKLQAQIDDIQAKIDSITGTETLLTPKLEK